MSLIVYDLFGEKRDKVQCAIDLVRSFEPPDKYYLAYSGGKDSIVVEAILRMAGVGYETHYNVTTVDPPELVRFVIRQFEAVIYDLPDGSFKYFAVNSGGRLLSLATAQSVAGKRCIHFTIPKLSMRQLIIYKQFPPTRLARYCCEALKESHGEGRVVVTGVRWDESAGRKRNQGTVTIFNGKAAKVAEQQGAQQQPRPRHHYELRRRGHPACRGDVLPNAQDDAQPDHRLDRRGCVGVHSHLQHPVLRVIRHRLYPPGLRWLPDGWVCRSTTGIDALATVLKAVRQRV